MADYISIPTADTTEPSPNAIALIWDRVDPSDPSSWRILGKTLADFAALLSTTGSEVVTAIDLVNNALSVTTRGLGGVTSETSLPIGEPSLLWDFNADELQIDGAAASRPYSADELFFAAGTPTTSIKSYALRRAFNQNRMLCFVSTRGEGGALPAVPSGAYANVHRLMPAFLLASSTAAHPAWETYVDPALRAGKYYSNAGNDLVTASVSSSNGVHPSNPFRGALQIWEM